MTRQNESKRHEDEGRLQDRASALFDASVQSLDAQTRSRLNRGRQRALAELGPGVRHPAWLRWAPAAGIAAVAVVAVFIGTGRPRIDESLPASTAADLEILLDSEALEMLEDLEFYSWIQLDEDDGAGGNVG